MQPVQQQNRAPWTEAQREEIQVKVFDFTNRRKREVEERESIITRLKIQLETLKVERKNLKRTLRQECHITKELRETQDERIANFCYQKRVHGEVAKACEDVQNALTDLQKMQNPNFFIQMAEDCVAENFTIPHAPLSAAPAPLPPRSQKPLLVDEILALENILVTVSAERKPLEDRVAKKIEDKRNRPGAYLPYDEATAVLSKAYSLLEQIQTILNRLHENQKMVQDECRRQEAKMVVCRERHVEKLKKLEEEKNETLKIANTLDLK